MLSNPKGTFQDDSLKFYIGKRKINPGGRDLFKIEFTIFSHKVGILYRQKHRKDSLLGFYRNFQWLTS